jgi:hypothetical protein
MKTRYVVFASGLIALCGVHLAYFGNSMSFMFVYAIYVASHAASERIHSKR